MRQAQMLDGQPRRAATGRTGQCGSHGMLGLRLPFFSAWGSRWRPLPRSHRSASSPSPMTSPRTAATASARTIFSNKLMELSKGALSINEYPSAQLGTEAQTMQKVQTGDIDFVMLSTANASTAQPESGVFSIHFIFRDEAHAIKVLGDPTVIAAMKELYAAKIKGAHMMALGSQGLRHMYGKKADPEGRRHQGRQGARAGDRDRGHAVPGLRSAGRAHAVRRGVHLAADGRRRHGRERHQQLPRQQALRAGAGALAHRARSQQRRAVCQRQGLAEPDRRNRRAGCRAAADEDQQERAGGCLQAGA